MPVNTSRIDIGSSRSQQILTLPIWGNETERTNKQTKKLRLNYDVEESSHSVGKGNDMFAPNFLSVWVKFAEKPKVAITEVSAAYEDGQRHDVQSGRAIPTFLRNLTSQPLLY
jgi:hypothetical protein